MNFNRTNRTVVALIQHKFLSIEFTALKMAATHQHNTIHL